jgi:hypothetical protein
MKIPPRIATGLWIVAWAVATAASIAIAKPMRAKIHIDEVYWIGSTYYYYLAFHERNWSHPDWRGLSARENPPVAKYVIGARLALAGQRVVDREMLACFRVGFYWPEEKLQTYSMLGLLKAEIGRTTLQDCGRAPLGGPGVTRKRDLLSLSRHAVVACAVVASFLMLLLGASIADRATGLVASQLLLFHPVVKDAYSHAMADAVAMMFTIGGAYAAWEFYRRMASDAPVSRRHATLQVLLNGTLFGLACGAKMNSLVVVFLFCAGALAAAAMAWKRGDRLRVRLTLGLATLVGVLTAAVFSLINPAIVLDPVAALPAVVTYQSAGLGLLQELMPDATLVTLGQKFAAMSTVVSGPATFLLVAALCALAAIRRPRAGVWFAGAWWLIATVLVTLWIPFHAPRYVLPVALPFVLLVAYAATSLLRRPRATSAPAS